MEAGYVVTEDGEKVLPGSRRPDGTIRKERRIRAGYVPQDEQPVYQSGGVMVRLLCQPLDHDCSPDTPCCCSSTSSSFSYSSNILQQQQSTLELASL
jgi:hypothetical protein